MRRTHPQAATAKIIALMIKELWMMPGTPFEITTPAPKAGTQSKIKGDRKEH